MQISERTIAWREIAQYTLLAGLLVLTGLAYWLHWGFTIDDAAISFSYARSFSQGFGLGALYPGAARVEGYSNLLWVALLGSATWLGANTLSASKILGLIFSIGTVGMTFLALNLVIRSKWLLTGIALVPLSLTFSFWSASGLENSLYALLIMVSVYLLLLEELAPGRFPYASALALVLVGMTRPEGAIYAIAGLAYKSIQTILARVKRKSDISNHAPGISHAQRKSIEGKVRNHYLRRLLIWAGILILGYLLYYVWRMWYFAYPLPNPVYAKSGWFNEDLAGMLLNPQGWVYLRGYFRTFAVIGALPAMVFGSLASLAGVQRVFPLFALASLALPLFSPDWMVNYRFLYPFIPFGAALVVLAGQQLWDWISPRASHQTWLRILGIGLAVWFAFGVARFAWANIRLTEKQLACGYDQPWAEHRCLDGKNYWSMAEVNARYANLQEYARQTGLADPTYLIPDIGATSYLQNLRLLDLGGLADVHLARARDHQTLELYLFSEQLPDFIMTHSIWTRRTDMTALSSLWDHYLAIETSQDANDVTHGTFIRKDLVLPEAEQMPSLTASQALELASGLDLLGIQAPQVFTPGFSPVLESYWQAATAQPDDLQLHLRLLDKAGQTHHETTVPLGYGWHPTSSWEPSQALRQAIVLPGDLPAGAYRLELRVVDSASQPISPAAASFEFAVDQQAARSQANALAVHSEELAEEDPQATLATLRQAAQIDPGLPGLSEQIDRTTRLAQLALLETAHQQFLLLKSSPPGDLAGLLETIYQNRTLQARRAVLPEWKAFAQDLASAAAQASNRGDSEKAYNLYLAASLADPNNAWAQRRLEETRYETVSR